MYNHRASVCVFRPERENTGRRSFGQHRRDESDATYDERRDRLGQDAPGRVVFELLLLLRALRHACLRSLGEENRSGGGESQNNASDRASGVTACQTDRFGAIYTHKLPCAFKELL